MKYNNFMAMEFPSVNSNEEFARKVVANFAEQLDPTAEELGDIRTAVTEAVSNAIVHAYPDSVGIIAIRCRILKDDTLDIVVKDKGVGIEDVERAKMPMFTTTSERSGMGFTIMESFMTSFEVKSEVGKGTTVHMKRHIVSRRNYNSSK
ncbi:MAG: anti-sigma F factor [Clostridia bacterium]|nr:anti-sigma F factor [Clostridia bacterium]